MRDIQAELDEALREAVEAAHASKGLLQLYDAQSAVLEVVAQTGFGEEFLQLFRAVKAFDPSACGRALGLKAPVVIDDVRTEAAFSPFMRTIEVEAFRSVKAMPLTGDEGIVGIVSIHFRDPQRLGRDKEEIPPEHLHRLARLLQDLSASGGLRTSRKG